MIKNQWYCRMESSEVVGKPVGVIRLGKKLVLFRDENGVDRMKEMIKENYNRIKAEAKQIIADELQRIKDDPDLCHLLPKEE